MGSHDKKRKESKSGDIDGQKKKHRKLSVNETSKRRASSIVPVGGSSFSEVVVKLYIHLAPIWAGKTMDGINDQLNAFLMKHIPQLDGIVLAHSDVELLSEKGKVLYDSPYCHFFIQVKFLIWRPKKGSKIVGRINLQSQDHIGLLIFGTFNASIPKSRISDEKYVWRASEEETTTAEDNESTEQTFDDDEKNQQGEWIIKDTGLSIGGDDGSLEFNVVDVIEANDILTVTGSVL
ncbi:unnamed protein product [Cunninghamella echinulata]